MHNPALDGKLGHHSKTIVIACRVLNAYSACLRMPVGIIIGSPIEMNDKQSQPTGFTGQKVNVPLLSLSCLVAKDITQSL